MSVQNPERSQSRPGRGKCRSGEVHQKCALKTEHEIYFHRKKKKSHNISAGITVWFLLRIWRDSWGEVIRENCRPATSAKQGYLWVNLRGRCHSYLVKSLNLDRVDVFVVEGMNSVLFSPNIPTAIKTNHCPSRIHLLGKAIGVFPLAIISELEAKHLKEPSVSH